MHGVIKKKHFWAVFRTFGFKAAMRLLFSREKTALTILFKIQSNNQKQLTKGG